MRLRKAGSRYLSITSADGSTCVSASQTFRPFFVTASRLRPARQTIDRRPTGWPAKADRHAEGEEIGLVGAQEAGGQQIEVERPSLGIVAQARLDAADARRPTESFDHQGDIPADLGLDLCPIEQRIGHIALKVIPAGVEIDPVFLVEGDRHDREDRREVQVAGLDVDAGIGLDGQAKAGVLGTQIDLYRGAEDRRVVLLGPIVLVREAYFEEGDAL